MDDQQALADAETYLIEVLETSDPPRNPALYNITEAAEEYHNTTGDWEIRQASRDTVEGLLLRHAKGG